MEKEQLLALAAQVGEGIKDTDLFKKYKEAEAGYRGNSELQAKIAEYTVQQQALANENAKPDANAFITEQIQKRINSLYADIMHDDSFEQFMSAQDELRLLMDDVNRAIMSRVNGKEDGEEETGCTGNCASCGGCH